MQHNQESEEIIISGMGELHLFVYLRESRESMMLISLLEIQQLTTEKPLALRGNSTIFIRNRLEERDSMIRLLDTLSQSTKISLMKEQIWATFLSTQPRDRTFQTSTFQLSRRLSTSSASRVLKQVTLLSE